MKPHRTGLIFYSFVSLGGAVPAKREDTAATRDI
jgi:hypothetical protein